MSTTPYVMDHSSHQQFFDYYAQASQKPETIARFRAIRDAVLRLRRDRDLSTEHLEVVDVGCGAGTQSMVWAELGHRVHGLDINQPLLELARERATAGKMDIDFRLGSSREMPWANDAIDVCVVLELLEHVSDWQECVRECSRILRRDGILVITTTNKLCPIQSEFNLPFYSWYPSSLKRYYENLASTSRPELANYATYPAVNWFTFYSLKDSLSSHGFDCKDRFDIKDLSHADVLTRTLVSAVRKNGFLRLLAHIASPGTIILGVKSRWSQTDQQER